MRDVPPLFDQVAGFIGKHKHGALGWFKSFEPEPIPAEWDPDNAERLERAGVAFLSLSEGSVLALVEPGDGSPDAVVLLGSEGNCQTVANSFEEFLWMWSNGETGIDELDDKDVERGRKALERWLDSKNVVAPSTKDFDFLVWLDGAPQGTPAPSPATSIERRPTVWMAELGPKVQKLASVIGLRIDEPTAVEYITETLGKKKPQSTSELDDRRNVVAPKSGVELFATHDVLNDAYPPINRTANSFVPYVSLAWVRKEIGEDILGVPWTATTQAEIEEILGPPNGIPGRRTIPAWSYPLDDGAHTMLKIDIRRGLTVTISVTEAGELERFRRVQAGLFLGWASINGLLDEMRFSSDAELLTAVKRHKATGAQLYDALPRGLWDDHLIPNDDLRTYAFGYFQNIGDERWITADLIDVFGKRRGPYGHDEPKLDDATWDAVERAAPIFAERFARWL